MFVIQTGLITTTVALGIVYWLSHHTEFDPMGFYVKLIIPLGAIGVGALAGSGYGIASAWTGAKIGRGLLLTVCALLVAAYFVAKYIEFRDLVTQYPQIAAWSFFDYYHFDTVNMTFTSTRSGSHAGDPLGLWGYAFRLLEIGGFLLGGLIVPGIMKARPYCDACQRYRTTKELGLLPIANLNAVDPRAPATPEAADAAAALYEKLRKIAEAGDAAAFKAELDPFAAMQKQIGKQPTRTRLRLIYCKGCSSGVLEGAILSGKGEHVKVELLPSAKVSHQFISGMGYA
jgi:hypothetical protein